MRRLLIARHARAASGAGLADHDRPLDPAGRQQAARAGSLVAEGQGLPALVCCSTARRARETVELMLRSWPARVPVAYDDAMYLATREALLAVVAAVPDEVERLMVVGHNPGLLGLAAGLAGTRSAADRLRGLPTAGLAVLACDGPWQALGWGTADLIDVVLPGP